jgi:hypothetical protein
VAIIIDEATDIDLAEGLVASFRELMAEYSNLAGKGILLVIAGVGLDAIKEKGSVGTNSAYSKLVRMKYPNIDEVEKVHSLHKAVLHALSEGLFSRILKTKARMFFRSVLPILQLDYHKTDAEFYEQETKRLRYIERLLEIASYRKIMDHATRFYVSSSSVKHLSHTTLNSLLMQSFVFHLAFAMEDAKGRIQKCKASMVQENLDRELGRVKGLDFFKRMEADPTGNIFAKGLATKNFTSDALKYMACFGLSSPLRPAFGDEFEELTALHFMRYMEVQGYQTKRVALKDAWPRKRTRGDFEKVIIKLNTYLKEQKKAELDDLKVAFHDLPTSTKTCFVFFPGDANCPRWGCSCFVGRSPRKDSKGGNHPMQALSSATELRRLSSLVGFLGGRLGLLLERGSQSSERPRWVFVQSLKFFCSEVCECALKDVDKDFKVSTGFRTMTVSFATPSTFPMPESKECRVWFREMFEPTISVLQPKEPPEQETMAD